MASRFGNSSKYTTPTDVVNIINATVKPSSGTSQSENDARYVRKRARTELTDQDIDTPLLYTTDVDLAAAGSKAMATKEYVDSKTVDTSNLVKLDPAPATEQKILSDLIVAGTFNSVSATSSSLTPTSNDELTRKDYVDEKINTEASARAAADTALQTNINGCVKYALANQTISGNLTVNALVGSAILANEGNITATKAVGSTSTGIITAQSDNLALTFDGNTGALRSLGGFSCAGNVLINGEIKSQNAITGTVMIAPAHRVPSTNSNRYFDIKNADTGSIEGKIIYIPDGTQHDAKFIVSNGPATQTINSEVTVDNTINTQNLYVKRLDTPTTIFSQRANTSFTSPTAILSGNYLHHNYIAPAGHTSNICSSVVATDNWSLASSGAYKQEFRSKVTGGSNTVRMTIHDNGFVEFTEQLRLGNKTTTDINALTNIDAGQLIYDSTTQDAKLFTTEWTPLIKGISSTSQTITNPSLNVTNSTGDYKFVLGSASLSMYRYGGNTGISTYKANGTASSPSAVLSGDTLFFVQIGGHNGSIMTGVSVPIRVKASENWAVGTPSSYGHQIEFSTVKNTSGSAFTRMTINNDGTVDLTEQLKLGSKTSSQIDSLANNAAGQLIYDTTENRVRYYNGTSWPVVDPGPVLHSFHNLINDVFQSSDNLTANFWMVGVYSKPIFVKTINVLFTAFSGAAPSIAFSLYSGTYNSTTLTYIGGGAATYTFTGAIGMNAITINQKIEGLTAGSIIYVGLKVVTSGNVNYTIACNKAETTLNSALCAPIVGGLSNSGALNSTSYTTTGAISKMAWISLT